MGVKLNRLAKPEHDATTCPARSSSTRRDYLTGRYLNPVEVTGLEPATSTMRT
jgi:hypothetical protein